MSLIIENDKDRRSLAWLLQAHSQYDIDAAAAAIESRGQRAYISMIAKELQTRVPDSVWGMQKEEIAVHRARLQQLRDEIAANAKNR